MFTANQSGKDFAAFWVNFFDFQFESPSQEGGGPIKVEHGHAILANVSRGLGVL